MEEYLDQAGLQSDYWASILKNQLRVTLPQQIQHLDESHLNLLKNFVREKWEKKALRKFLCLNSEPSSSQARDDDKTEIAIKLSEVGLDGEYWAGVLETYLGITTMVQTSNIDNITQLKNAIRYEWEEKALKTFFNIGENTYEASLNELKKQNEQRIKEAKISLEEVIRLREEGVSRCDARINEKMCQLRQSMRVAEEHWVQRFNDESFDEMISKLTSELMDLSKLAESRNANTASELLANASAGLALRGVIVGKKSDNFETSIVLSPPTEVKLRNPVLPQVEEIVHFVSRAQADRFHQSFDTLGYSLAVALEGLGWSSKAEAQMGRNEDRINEKQSDSHKQSKFESKVMYSVVPTASCELDPNMLKLSHRALKDLKTIDKLLVGSKNSEIVMKKCEEFLNSYGSHVNAGVLHFGGVNKFVATYTSDIESKSDKITALVQDALNIYAGASLSGFGFTLDGSVSADHLTSYGSFTAEYEKSDQAKTRLYTSRNGGPQEVSTLPLWKMELLKCSSNWALIDRGKTLSRNFIGIWKLIPNHGEEFTASYELASCLLTAWERMAGNFGIGQLELTLLQGIDAIDQLVQKIKTWNSEPVLSGKCIGYLQEILSTVDQVGAQTGTKKYWEEQLCKGVHVTNFMEKVIDIKDNLTANDVLLLKFLMGRLIFPMGNRDFRGKEKIMKFADVNAETVKSSSPLLLLSEVKNVPDLLWNLKERCLTKLQREHANNTEENVKKGDDINIAATCDLAVGIGQLRTMLQSSGEFHEVFFLEIVLLPYHYHWPTQRFEVFLTMEKFHDFVQFFEESWRNFQIESKKGIIQLESFLLNTVITNGQFDQRGESYEEKFSHITREFKQVISSEVNMVLNRYATHTPFNWVEMIRVTSELSKGNMSVIQDGEVDIGDLRQVLDLYESNAQDERPTPSFRSEVRAQGTYLAALETLGLVEYYPSKITLLDAMVVKKETKHPNMVDLPWLIIRKVLMLDFNARDQVWSSSKDSDGEHISDSGGNFDTDDFLSELESASDGEDEETLLSTLDVLIAIFTCCDNFLKQTLAQKLFVCKLAVPFLYPVGFEGNIAMSLWALRAITVQSLTKNKEATETPVTDSEFPIVTFVRLGRPDLSKSKLINDVLTDGSHNTFFNYDCNNGTVNRRLTDGLVECSWFISSGKDKEHLPETSMILNLRGDASLMEKQMQVLLKISSLVVTVATVQDLAKHPNTMVCQQILKSGAKVILFLMSERDDQNLKNLSCERKTCIEAVGKNLLQRARIISSSTRKGIRMNASEVKNKFRKQISEAMADVPVRMTMDECARLAESIGIIIDEYDDGACLHGKTLAENVLNHMNGKEIVDCKRILLPLQGNEWIEYCKLLKKHHRACGKDSESSSSYRAGQVKQKMDGRREKQVEICSKGLTPFIKCFMSNLKNNQNIVVYYLKWINILLDKKSRENLPGLRKRYNTLWYQLQMAKRTQDTATKGLQSKVHQAENQLASASFGLEHLFRELGQIYEAVNGCSSVGQDTRAALECLPETAAKLLMRGIPLELVDGDASSVPITWVTAVLGKLANKIKEKRLFVLSVLGIQSSGKSTLLNTMFGLQFAVSAGRCTRGAYMQLIQVDELSKLPFDYIVVIDTEGLRAPELGNAKHEHDNELATLVIGLGDVTMINIKGENTAEIKDILQIAVHAILRMKLVSKHITDHRTCLFIHQNVPAANAAELMLHGCQKLQESLDEMTEEAARSEQITDIHNFSQVINFDVHKHVWYFADLWHGNPPMAPANPGYSEKVNEVRESLLEDIAKEQTTFLTTSDLSLRIADLWNGVLADDFVFSFRNSLEVKAYNSLQSTYYGLEWKLQNEMRAWLQKEENQLKMKETVEDIENYFIECTVTFRNVLTQKGEEVENCLKEYFNKNNLKEIIIQWQQSKINQLKFAVEQQKQEGTSSLLSVKEARKLEILQKEKWSGHVNYISIKAVDLAHTLKGENVTNDELLSRFNFMWGEIMQELVSNREDEYIRIDILMEHILLDRLHDHVAILKEEIRNHPLTGSPESTSLECNITQDDVKDYHISVKLVGFQKYKHVTGTKKEEQLAKNKTVLLTGRILQEISNYIKELTTYDTKFQRAHARKVIEILVDKIEAHNREAHESKENTFTILPKYVVELAVRVSCHCVQVFSSMQIEYNKRHGVQAKLECYRDRAWSLFKNVVKQSTEEVIASDLLCTEVKTIVEQAVKEEIRVKCVDEVLRDFERTKYSLILQIMEDLARKGNFKEYQSYIKNAKKFALKWITRYTNDKIFSTEDEHGLSRYAELTKSHIESIMNSIIKSVSHAAKEATDKNISTMGGWVQIFCQKVSGEIALPVSTLDHVSIRLGEVANFVNLQGIIMKQLKNTVENDLIQLFSNTTKDSVNWDGPAPPEKILDKIWGCSEQCPFCKEPCADTTVDHFSRSGKSHICVQHRPDGIRGGAWKEDGEIDGVSVRKGQLSHDTCNFSVQRKNVLFTCSYCEFKCKESGKCTGDREEAGHEFIEYKTFIPSWDIAPDSTNNVSKYWMWFMATYQSQLKEMYDAELPILPESWKSVTREEALRDLRKYHN